MHSLHLSFAYEVNVTVLLTGLPAVVSLVPHAVDQTLDGLTFGEACRKLEEAGADVVGVNCCRGPDSMMPLAKEIRKACKVQIIERTEVFILFFCMCLHEFVH